MSKHKGRMVIIDGSGYIFRAYYAIGQKLTAPDGTPVNAVFGFVNMLLKVIEDLKPDHLAITFDTPKPTFRKVLFDGYKANRAEPPEDLKPQFAIIQEAVDSFGIPRLQMEGFEADDVIGTLAKQAVEQGYKVEIVTGDKDLMQLVNDDVLLIDTMRDKRIDADAVKEKFQVGPDQVTEVLALMGDSSDNIPGVSGIGPKTAAELILKFGTVENLYQRLDEIPQEKRRTSLAEQKDMALLSRKLVEIDCKVPMDFQWADFLYRLPEREKLESFLKKYRFTSLTKRLGFEDAADKFEGANYQSVQDIETLRQVAKKMEQAGIFAFDTETTSLRVQDAECVGLSLCATAGESYYVPVGHCALGDLKQKVSGQLGWDDLKAVLVPIFENPNIKKIGQNLKYDIQVLRRHGIHVQGAYADTLLQSYLIDPTQSHGLDALALKYLHHKNIAYDEVTGKGKNQINFAEVEIQKAAEYAAEDADATWRLHQILFPQVEDGALGKLFFEIEMPLVEVLADMEYTGVLVDEARLKQMSVELEQGMGVLEKVIYELAGEPVNINSPKQLSALLFQKLKLPVIKKTKTGISTDESVLIALADEHEICGKILKYRELGKLRSTFVEGLLQQIHSQTGRVHTHYNQTVTATGRLSSSNPNLQNIPIGGDPQYDVRAAFIARNGCELLSADYSQVELRLLAHMSQDAELLRAFRNDEDVHSHTGKLIFGTTEVTSEQRRVAKTINFGVVYGQTAFGLSKTLGIPVGQAKEFIDRYFARYHGVQQYMRSLIEKTRQTGFAYTELGRRRAIPEIHSQNRMMREMAERTAINTPLQGTAADMIKKAMVAIYRQIQNQKLESRMILQVHDELVLEVPHSEKTAVEAIVVREMEAALALSVPLKVEYGWGPSWQAAK
jgi:DNA polymerase I